MTTAAIIGTAVILFVPIFRGLSILSLLSLSNLIFWGQKPQKIVKLII